VDPVNPTTIYAGTGTVAPCMEVFTPPDALIDGVVGPLDVLAATLDFSAAP
jgi:hypothetical protein